jgi:Calx-beta domain
MSIFVDSAMLEGDTGTTTNARFDVRLSAATGRTVSVNFATANINASGGAACGTPGVDYESTSGTITFRGTTLISVPVKVCGDSSAEANEQFTFTLSNPVNATIGLGSAFGIIINDDVMELLLEDSGPGVNQAAALDSLFFVRDPFRVVTVPDAFANGTDKNTRVALFVRNLDLNPGETSSAVVVRIIGSNNQFFDVPAEDFRAVPGVDFKQVTFRLPNALAAGTATMIVRAHGRASNLGTIRIAP